MRLTILMWLFPALQDTLPDPVTTHDLPQVTIRSRSPMGLRRGDTIVFSVDRFKSLSTQRVDDLIRIMPGFQVDNRGRITYGGKEVSRVFIDGEDLAGDHYSLVSQLLSASLIDSLHVIHQFHPNRLLRSIHPEQGVAINLITKKQYRAQLQSSFVLKGRSTSQWNADARIMQLRQKNKMILQVGRNAESTLMTKPSQSPHPFLLQREWMSSTDISEYHWPGRFSQNINVVKNLSVSKYMRSRLLVSHGTIRLRRSGSEVHHFFDGTRILGDQLNEEQRATTFFEWQAEVDAGRLHTGTYQLKIERLHQIVLDQQTRSTATNETRSLYSNSANASVNLHQQDTWRLKNGTVLQCTNSYIHDRLTDNRAFVYRRGDLQQSILFWKKNRQSTFKMGLHRLLHLISSLASNDSVRVQLSKQYLHLQSNHILSSRLNAGITGMIGWTNDHARSYPMYHTELLTTLQLSRMQQITINFSVLRTLGDLNTLHAGPLQRSAWEQLVSNGQLSFPQTRSGTLTYTRMDLYRSMLAGIQINYSAISNEMINSILIHGSAVDVGYFIAPLSIDKRVMGFIEYVVFPIRIRFRSQITYFLRDATQKINDQLSRILFRQIHLLHEIRTQWKRRWSIEAMHRLQWNKNSSTTFSTFTLRYAVEKKMQGEINYQRSAVQYQNSVHLLNTTFIWVPQKNFRIELMLANALNYREVKWIVVSPQSIYEQRSPIIGRSLAIRWVIDF